MITLVRSVLIAARWPLAALAFLVAFNAKAGAADATPAAFPTCVTLTLT